LVWFCLNDSLKINRTKPNHIHFYLAIKMILILKTEPNRTAITLSTTSRREKNVKSLQRISKYSKKKNAYFLDLFLFLSALDILTSKSPSLVMAFLPYVLLFLSLTAHSCKHKQLLLCLSIFQVSTFFFLFKKNYDNSTLYIFPNSWFGFLWLFTKKLVPLILFFLYEWFYKQKYHFLGSLKN
jgi:hypothetical protein